VVTHRSDLHAALLAACRETPLVTVSTGERGIEVRETGEDVSVLTARGGTYSAPLLIGADGLHSVVRQYVIGPAAPVCTGDVAYRGTVPRAPELVDQVADLTWWVGPGMHLIQ